MGNAGIILGSVPDGPGHTFIDATLNRAGLGIARVLRGYIYDMHDPTHPGPLEGPVDGPGRDVSNEAASTLANNAALTRTITVPTDTRWLLYGGAVFNADDVTRTVTILADDGTSGQERHRFKSAGMGTLVRAAWPSAVADDHIRSGMPVPLDEGDRILITFAAGGASAGGEARSSANVEEWIKP